MPFKANADRRHHIPKQRRRVTNWAEYDAALRQRGSLTVWFTEEAIAAWEAEPRTTPAPISIGLERHRGSSVIGGVVHLPQPSPDANRPIRATNSRCGRVLDLYPQM